MKIETLVLGQLETNCYLVYDEKTKEAIVIDPADEGNFIIQKILDLKLRPRLIIATHGHFDHLLGALELKLAFNLPFLMHQADLPILKRTQETSSYFLGIAVDPPPPVDKFVKEGDKISFGKSELKVIETPGHTPGGICLYTLGTLFSGDTLFADGIGRTDLSYASHEQLIHSIKEKLFQLPEKTIVYPGHGISTTIQTEKESLKITKISYN